MPIAFTKKQSAFLFFPAQFSVQLQLSAARSFMDGSIQTTGSLFLLTKGRHSMEFLTHIIFLLNLLKTLINHFSWWVVALSGNSSQSDFGLDQVAADSGDYGCRPAVRPVPAKFPDRHHHAHPVHCDFCNRVPLCPYHLPQIFRESHTPERANLIFCWCSCSTVSDASQMKRHLS